MVYQILVTAAIIEKDGKYLITQRPAEKHNGLRWEFPGGKVNPGEDPRDCLAREIKEEIDLDVVVGSPFEYSSHVYSGEKHVVLLAFICKYKSGQISKKEIQDYAWVAPSDMKHYDITEADHPFVQKLMNGHKA